MLYSAMNSDGITTIVIKILKKYPLCDRCLGRLFARLSKNLGNDERGKALKITTIMELHKMVLEGNKEALNDLKEVLINSKMPLIGLLKEFNISYQGDAPRCYICEDRLNEVIDTFSELIAKNIVESKRESFLIGVVVPHNLIEKELNIAGEFQLQYWESIKRELKREIGKKVQQLTGVKVDFEAPQVTYIVNLINNTIKMEIRSLFIYGVYKKFGRMISQKIWLRKDGTRKYKLAIEDAIKSTLIYVKASDAVMHIAGREDVDVRMLGNGRPIILEYKNPYIHTIDLKTLNDTLNSFSPWIKFNLKMTVRRNFVSRVKKGSTEAFKIYRAIIYSDKALSSKDLVKLEKEFEGKIVMQRTPTRVLSRKRDRVRYRQVYQVKTLYIQPHLFEALIKCEGGLYVKELITGDNGRTLPSFSQALNSTLNCLMLDVLYVHEHI